MTEAEKDAWMRAYWESYKSSHRRAFERWGMEGEEAHDYAHRYGLRAGNNAAAEVRARLVDQ